MGRSRSRRGDVPSAPMKIFLIRHGQTDLNAARVLQMPETPLSQVGHEQARRLAAHLAESGIQHILSSDLARAQQTAEPLQQASGVTLELEPLLQERNFGDLRGTAYADLSEDPFAPGFSPPGGETEEVFADRVEAAFRRIVEVASGLSGPLAVVTHGLVCRGIVSTHVENTLDPAAATSPLQFRNTSFSVIEGSDPLRLVTLGQADHLEGLEGSEGGAA